MKRAMAGAPTVRNRPRRQSQAHEPIQMTAQPAVVEAILYRKWAADSPRDSISWLTARDMVPAVSEVNQRSGRRAILSPTAWWTSCMKPSAPVILVRCPWKSVTVDTTAQAASATSQPPKPRPQQVPPLARATEAGRRARSASPDRAPLNAPRARPLTILPQESSVMSRW